eukprot:m.466002 g.466002  ORF g.466002 m.466002 type:complete len:200 (-) comp24808_c0_seq1:614-1213(-)
MGMYHSTSGKIGYAPHSLPCAGTLTKDEAIAVLTREDALRASDAIQAEYTAALEGYRGEHPPAPPGESSAANTAISSPQDDTKEMHRVLQKLADTTTRLQEEALTAVLGQARLLELGGVSEALIALHNTRFAWQADPEVNQLTVYQRQDKSTHGNLSPGDPAPDTALLRLNPDATTDSTSVRALERPDRPLVLICGSIS